MHQSNLESIAGEFASIVGARHVLAGPADMDFYLTDERGLFRGEASLVVKPGTTQEVSGIVAICHRERLPMVAVGGNSGTCGGTVPLGGAKTVVVATERLNRIRNVDRDNHTITVEAGCILANVQRAAEEAGCFFPLSLGGEGTCLIGGNLSTNAGGVNVLRYGNTRDLMLGLEVVLPDGRVWNGLRGLRKDNSGLALRHLFVGAEGLLGIITAATLKLFAMPPARHTAFCAVANPADAIALLGRIKAASADTVTAFELFPRIAFDVGFRNIEGGRDPFAEPHPWYALIELSAPAGFGTLLEDALSAAVEDGLVRDAVIAQSGEQRKALWRLREIGAGGHQYQEGGLIKHDISVPLSRIPEMIERGIEAVTAALPGIRPIPFGHAGDGNLHFNLVQPVGADKQAFLAERPRMNRIIHDIVHELGGSIAAEHGIGMLKVGEMARYKDPLELELMRRVKDALDPLGLMNPGKVIPPA